MKRKIKIKKQYSTVKVLRKIRERISKKIMNMTFAEEKAYLKKLLADDTSIAAEPEIPYGKKK